MHLELQLLIASVGAAGALALLSCGLVVIYRGSGILNFAHGANATAACYVYLWLWNEHGWSAPTAAIAGVLAAVVIGTGFQILVLARLGNASVLMRTVATLGLMLTVQGAIAPLFGTTGFSSAPELFPSTTWRLPLGSPGFQLESTRFSVFVLALSLTIGLWALFKFSRFGLVTSGISENQTAVLLLGWKVPRLQATNWAIGSAMAGLAGVFLASLVPVSPSYFTQALIVAFAAAVVGRFANFWVTFLSAVLIALAQPIIALHDGALLEATNLQGWDQVLPFLLIIVVLLRQGSVVPSRATAAAIKLPSVSLPTRPALWVAVVTVVLLALILTGSPTFVAATSTTMVYALVCLSVVTLTGLTGQISLAQMSFAGFSAFVTALVSVELGVPFPLPLVIGTLCALPLGLLVGIPALRVRGVSLAILTLAFAVMMENLVFSNSRINGGQLGRFLEAPNVFGQILDPLVNPRGVAIFSLVVVMGAFYATLKLVTLKPGRTFLAIRNSERAAASAGVSVRATKLFAFGLAATLAGLAGSLLTYQNLFVSYDRFNVLASILLLAMVAVGGLASGGGAVVGAVMVPGAIATFLLNEVWGGEWQAVLAGALLIITVLLNQDGIAPETRRLLTAVWARRSRTNAQGPGRGSTPGVQKEPSPSRAFH